MIGLFPTVWLLLYTVNLGSSWHMFSDMADTPRIGYKPSISHSTYVFGDCKRRGIILFSHVHLEGLQILGKLFARGWLDIKRIPTCIILKSYSYNEEQLRGTAERFQICVPRITYCHTHKRYKYFYYEWHLPYSFMGVKLGSCWNSYYSQVITDKDNIHNSKYIFGDCDLNKDVKLYVTVEQTAAVLKGKVLVRGFLEGVRRQPTCVILRSIDNEVDAYPETPYNFQFCVARVTYIYTKRKFLLFFYEWYIMPGFNYENDWEILFYGPTQPLEWK